MYGVPYNYDSKDMRHKASVAVQQSNRSSEVRAALDAFRRIVQALRVDASPGTRRRRLGLSTAQLFALQRIAEHPSASINDIAALTFTHQSSVSVVIQRLVRRRLVTNVTARDDKRRHRLALTAEGRRALRRAPVAGPERLIDAIAELSAKDRRVLARLLGEVAQSIAPKGDLRPPPMFFEERRHQQKTRT